MSTAAGGDRHRTGASAVGRRRLLRLRVVHDMSTVSGWCQSPPGVRPDAHHDECERRMQAGLLDRCGCPRHESEEEPQSALVQG